MTSPPLLEAKDVQITFHTRRQRGGGARVVRAVDDVSLTVRQGEILGLVGESGSGKTTLGQALVGLQKPDHGRVLFEGDDVHAQHGKAARALRRHMQIVFQESRGSLNGRMRVEDIIGEGLRIQHTGDRETRRRRVKEVAQQVGLGSVDLSRYPHQFSGGQRQRIGIARALAVEPRFLVADEPVASLDVSVQAQVLNLLLDLRTELGLTYVLISHDLAVVERVSDAIAVMYMGCIMEQGTVSDVFERPQVPYTYALLSARPTMPGRERYSRVILPGDVGEPGVIRQGCPFAPRCWMAADVCRESRPELRETRPGHWAACHFAGQIDYADGAGSAGSTGHGAALGSVAGHEDRATEK
jgi:oligopeptide/dipeptide ABC transporter ATP-binding protein